MKNTQKKSFKTNFTKEENLNIIEISLVCLTCFLFVAKFIVTSLLPNLASILSIVIGCVVIFSLLLTKIIEKYKDKLKRKRMQTKVEDYKKQDDILSNALNVIVCAYFAVTIYCTSLNFRIDFEKWNLTSTNIGLYSFIFVIFTFILPTYKKEIKNIESKINEEISNELLNSDDVSAKNKIAFLQSEIYFFKKEFNLLTQNIIVNGILFVLSILAVFTFELAISKILSISSILFCCINVINILFELKRLYNYDLNKNEHNINGV